MPFIGEICPVVSGAKNVVDFAKDPLGYLAQHLQDAASGLANTILPGLEKLTHPDLSQSWWLHSYEVAFGLALFLWVVILLWDFVQLARHQITQSEMAEALTTGSPLFLVGATFAPLAATALLDLTGTLTDSLARWGLGETITQTNATLQATIQQGSGGQVVGGDIVAIIFFACLCIALIMTLATLLVMMVTLYLSGAVFPLALVWVVNPRHRHRGMRIVHVWSGVLFSQVLLFLLLGTAFKLIGWFSTQAIDDPGLKTLANLLVAIIVLAGATLFPMGLLRFAPVGPGAAASGPRMGSFSSGGSGVGGYPESSGDSQMGQLGRDSAVSLAEPAGGAGEGGSGAGVHEGSSGGGGLVSQVYGGRQPESDGTGDEPEDEAPVGAAETSATGAGTGAPSPEAATQGAEAGPGGGGMSGQASGAAGGPAGTAAGGGEAAGGGAVEGGATGGGLAAAGGVVAGAALAGAALASVAQKGHEHAAAQMDHGEQEPTDDSRGGGRHG